MRGHIGGVLVRFEVDPHLIDLFQHEDDYALNNPNRIQSSFFNHCAAFFLFFLSSCFEVLQDQTNPGRTIMEVEFQFAWVGVPRPGSGLDPNRYTRRFHKKCRISYTLQQILAIDPLLNHLFGNILGPGLVINFSNPIIQTLFSKFKKFLLRLVTHKLQAIGAEMEDKESKDGTPSEGDGKFDFYVDWGIALPYFHIYPQDPLINY